MEKRMLSKKFILILFFFFAPSTFSFIRLFKITANSSTPYTIQNPAQVQHKLTLNAASHEEGDLDTKEYRLLTNLISQKAPCNLLFFGYKPQFLNLAILNAKGTTTFLEDDEVKLKRATQQTKRVRISIVNYQEKASDAYELLKHAREHYGCKLEAVKVLQETGCRLGPIVLKEVNDRSWDVVVVDGPRGNRPEAPGRMEAIYTAAVIARTGTSTDVFVHDVDRMIEKWYSWEFLCHENLVSSKGKLWHFRVEGKSTFTSFCPESKIQIV